jgi:integrase
MTTLYETIDAMVASSRELDSGSIHRLQFWQGRLGHLLLSDVTADDVDDALDSLVTRGKLRAGRGLRTQSSGKPLSPATVTRYVSTLGGVYRWAKAQRLLRKSHIAPTRGVQTHTSPVNKNKFLTADEVNRVIKVARVTDRLWKKLPCLITLGFHTGLRAGSLKTLRWRDIDWAQRTAYVQRTKNGEPHVAPLSSACMTELNRLPKGQPDELIFSGRTGKPYEHRNLLCKTVNKAGLPGRTFHWLRHSCGSELARQGVSQAQIMAVMGHKSFASSARYIHANVNDRRAVVESVFG